MVTVYGRSIFQLWVTIKGSLYHKDSITSRPLNKVKPCSAAFATNTTCCNNFLFSFPFEGAIKDCRTPQPCVMSLFLFLRYLFLISTCPHSRVYLQYRTIVQMNSQTRRSNSSQFSWLLVVLNNNLDLIAIFSSVKTNPRYDIPH